MIFRGPWPSEPVRGLALPSLHILGACQVSALDPPLPSHTTRPSGCDPERSNASRLSRKKSFAFSCLGITAEAASKSPALAQQATGSGGALFTTSVFVKWHFSVLFPLPVPSTRTVRHQSRLSAYLPRTPSMTAFASILAKVLMGRSIVAIQFGPDPLGLRGMIWTYSARMSLQLGTLLKRLMISATSSRAVIPGICSLRIKGALLLEVLSIVF